MLKSSFGTRFGSSFNRNSLGAYGFGNGNIAPEANIYRGGIGDAAGQAIGAQLIPMSSETIGKKANFYRGISGLRIDNTTIPSSSVDIGKRAMFYRGLGQAETDAAAQKPESSLSTTQKIGLSAAAVGLGIFLFYQWKEMQRASDIEKALGFGRL